MLTPTTVLAQGLGFVNPADSLTAVTSPDRLGTTIATDPAPAATANAETATSAVSVVPAGATSAATTLPGFQATNNYNIRNQNGDRLCSVSKGTPLTPTKLNADGDYAYVTFNSDRCPGTGGGWISINGLQPTGARGSSMMVDGADSLSLRSSPGSANNRNLLCSLPKDTAVSVVEQRPATDTYRAWVRVHIDNPPGNCPAEGWVHSEYLRASDNLLASLPREAANYGSPEDAQTEATTVVECTNCTTNNQIQDLKDVVAGVQSLGNIDTWRRNRGLVRMPLRGSAGNVGPCGSHHYNPDNANGIDAYAAPITACVMMSLLQDWKARYPDRSGSTIQWGDISHKTRPKWNGHRSHTEGNCIDFRPMRTGGFSDTAITRWSDRYSRSRTTEFIEMAKAKGASVVLFNDSRTGAGYAGGHDNHVHICFPSNATTRETCRNYQYDPNICGAQ